ncbi:MAG: hypothetical protein HC811_03255 [Flammeovirgaceae bacterium]|nr:hypothetical protein [Flammeovirgaceae bacterium]
MIVKVANAQSVSTFMGAQAAGLGYAVSTSTNEWSAINNIGGLAYTEDALAAFAVEIMPALEGANRLNALGWCHLVITLQVSISLGLETIYIMSK